MRSWRSCPGRFGPEVPRRVFQAIGSWPILAALQTYFLADSASRTGSPRRRGFPPWLVTRSACRANASPGQFTLTVTETRDRGNIFQVIQRDLQLDDVPLRDAICPHERHTGLG